MSGKSDRCVSLVIENEGGYVNHPKDQGGDDRERLWGDNLCHPDHKWGRKADIWRWLHAAQLTALSPYLIQGLLPIIELESYPALVTRQSRIDRDCLYLMVALKQKPLNTQKLRIFKNTLNYHLAIEF